jgi:NADP-dependent aldehyde dehydrogenase
VGQFCTKPGLVFAVRGPETDSFLAALAEAVRAAAPGIMLTPGIRTAFAGTRERLLGHRGVRPFAESGAPAVAGAEGRAAVATVAAADFLAQPELSALEVFGPFTLVVVADSADQFAACARALEGQLTATVHGTADELAAAGPLVAGLERKAGRVLLNGFPTGVEVAPAMHHGGPYPATSDTRFTSVGTAAILRFARPVCYQNFPETLLPDVLRNANPSGLMRLVNGTLTRDAVS